MSSINPNNIDGAYPIAGQDNDSQGFRTNFTNIRNNLTYAKAELDDLQSKGIFKSALTGTTLDNNLAGAIIRAAEIKDFRETRVDFGLTSGSLTLNHASGHYYTVSTGGNISIDFSNFPDSGKLGRIAFEVTVGDSSDTLSLPASVTYGLQGIAGLDDSNVITFNEVGTYVFEFTTENGGTDVHIADFSRARTYFHSQQITLQQRTPANTGRSGDVAGMIAVDADYLYVCTGTYDGSTAIWSRTAVTAY